MKEGTRKKLAENLRKRVNEKTRCRLEVNHQKTDGRFRSVKNLKIIDKAVFMGYFSKNIHRMPIVGKVKSMDGQRG